MHPAHDNGATCSFPLRLRPLLPWVWCSSTPLKSHHAPGFFFLVLIPMTPPASSFYSLPAAATLPLLAPCDAACSSLLTRIMLTLKMLGPRPLSNYGILILFLKAPAVKKESGFKSLRILGPRRNAVENV